MIFRFFVWRPSFEVSLPSSPSVKASSVVNAHNHKALMNGRDIIFMSHPFCKKTSTMKTLFLLFFHPHLLLLQVFAITHSDNTVDGISLSSNGWILQVEIKFNFWG